MQNENLNAEEQLKFENELIKLKLQAERGAVFFTPNETLPAQLEHQFLTNILNMQQGLRERKTQTVYEYIGKPEFIVVAELSHEEIEREYARLLNIIENNSIDIIYDYDYDIREMYRFITEDIFQKEIETYSMPGWYYVFVYEDYYPNYEENIKVDSESALYQLFSLDPHEMGLYPFAEEMHYSGKKLTVNEFMECFRHFKDAYDKMKIYSIDFDEPEIRENVASISFSFRFQGALEGTGQEIEHEQKGKFDLIVEDDQYRIQKVELPGIL